MSIRIRIISILVFCFGVLLFTNTRLGQTQVTLKSHEVTYIVSNGKADEAKEPSGLYTRVVKASGEWKEIRYDFNGKKIIRVATDDVQYSMKPNDNSRQFESKYSLEMHKDFSSESFLKNHPEFLRKETILGLDTYVLRGGDKDVFMETNYAPECGATPLKKAMYNHGHVMIIEAVKIEFREISDDEVSLPQISTQFDQAEKKAEMLKRNGLTKQADTLSESIKQLKQKQNKQ